MNELFSVAREIVLQRYTVDDKNYSYLVFACFCLLTKFNNCIDVVRYVVLNTEVIIEDEPLEEIAKKIEDLDLEEDLDYYDLENKPVAASSNGICFDENEVFLDNAKIIISSVDNSSETLSTLVHEFAHLIKSFFKSYAYTPSGYCLMRNGLDICESWADGTERFKYKILDEVINTLQTKDMTENVKNIEEDYLLPKEKSFLKQLDYSILEDINGYDKVTYLFLDIWKEEEFRDIFEDELILGNISNIKANFNNLVNDELFDKLAWAVDICFEEDNIDAYLLVKNIIELINIHIKNKKKLPSKSFKKNK